MILGIISRCKGKSRKRGLFWKVLVCNLSENVLVAEIPFSLDEISKMPDKRRERVLKKAENALRNAGADKIILTRELKKEPFDIAEIFYKLVPNAVRLISAYFEIEPLYTLCVRQKSPDFKAFSVLKSLIFDGDNIKVLTDKAHKGAVIRERIMEEFGAVTEIFPYNFVSENGITVNLDKNEVCVFGKWVLKDFTLDVETFGYDVDSVELFYQMGGDFDEIVIKGCVCGKNKLTLDRK